MMSGILVFTFTLVKIMLNEFDHHYCLRYGKHNPRTDSAAFECNSFVYYILYINQYQICVTIDLY